MAMTGKYGEGRKTKEYLISTILRWKEKHFSSMTNFPTKEELQQWPWQDIHNLYSKMRSTIERRKQASLHNIMKGGK